MTQNFIENEIPEFLQERYMRRLSEGKDETLEGQILSVADKVDLLYESFGEIQKGNPQSVYLDIFRESLSTIIQFKALKSVQYFLNEVLPDLLNEQFADRARLVAISDELLKRQWAWLTF